MKGSVAGGNATPAEAAAYVRVRDQMDMDSQSAVEAFKGFFPFTPRANSSLVLFLLTCKLKNIPYFRLNTWAIHSASQSALGRGKREEEQGA